ncbi:MAG: penicillin-binding protein 2 [Bacteroidota bacterium]
MIDKFSHIRAVFIIVAVVFTLKLFHIQVFDDNYRKTADNNIIRKIIKYPLRGMIFDRNGKLIVRNKPVFDLMFSYRELEIEDTTTFCNFFNIEKEALNNKLIEAKEKRNQPIALVKQLSVEEFAKIQDRLNDFQGIYVQERTLRDYPQNSMANIIGYVKEVDKDFLATSEGKDYRQGDLIGKSGLERKYEPFLKGDKGVSFVMTNVRGIQKGKFQNGTFDTLPQVGKDLYTGIDLQLQRYGEKLMQNKKGAIVAIEPETGQVLAMISAPSYDPNLLTGEGEEASNNFLKLIRDPSKPLFNRTIQAAYPPGSTFKTVMALTGLQNQTLDSVNTYFSCDRSLVGCHGHPSPLNLYGSIQHSCNPFYFKALRKIILTGKKKNEREDTRIGMQAWHDKLSEFGLGKKTGIDLPFEKSGLLPSPTYYDKNYYIKEWRLSNVYSIGIGQGEVLLTPIQLANQAATIANRGWYITPHLVNKVGDTKLSYEKHDIDIEREYFDYIARAMSQIYTARLAKHPDIVICGKTGTAQNPHGEDHSVFMAFAPLKNPKIAIAVYVENAGFGGTWAAPIASLIIEKYLKGKIDEKRIWIENYALAGNFMEVQ